MSTDETGYQKVVAAVRAAAEDVFSGKSPGFVLVTQANNGGVTSQICKGTPMGGTLFLHAIINAIRALGGFYETGLPVKPFSMALRTTKDGEDGLP